MTSIANPTHGSRLNMEKKDAGNQVTVDTSMICIITFTVIIIIISAAAIAVALLITTKDNQDCTFYCDNRLTCVKSASLCNEVFDCQDQTDESINRCINSSSLLSCTTGISCDNNKNCVPPSRICDDITDCSDGKDEVGCITSPIGNNTNTTYFDCSSKQRISITKVCDLVQDCTNGHDEVNCAISKSGTGNDFEIYNTNTQLYHSMCSTNWNGEYSKVACQALGFSGVFSTSYLSYTKDQKLITVTEGSLNSWVTTNQSSTCDSNLRVSLVCEKSTTCGKTYWTGKIVGGTKTDIRKLPWQASLQGKDSEWIHQCGAVVVSSNIAVTAGHCVYESGKTASASSRRIMTSSNTISNTDRTGVYYYIASITIHPHYDNNNLDYDIAILKTQHKMTFTNYLQPACLPTPGQQFVKEEYVTVSGWGYLSEDGNLPSNALQSVSFYMIAKTTCLISYEYLTDRMICAGDLKGGIDACQGDSGGPLVHKLDDQSMLVGLVSSGEGCARAGYPGIYTDVALFSSWIRQNS